MKNLSEILKLCAQNDRRAQQQLFEQYFPLMINASMRYTKDRNEALSNVNMSFLKAMKAIHTVDEKRFTAWLKRIVINHVIDEHRKNKRYAEAIELNNDAIPKVAATNQAMSNLVEKDILNLLTYLQPTTSSIFKLHAIDGFKHHEISSMLNITESKSKWHLAKAKTELKELYTSLMNDKNG